MEEAVRADLAPDSESAWSRFARQAAWASASGLARELAGARGPHWWRPLIRQAVPQRPAHEAFWSIVLAPEIWDEQGARDSADWGRCAAPFWMRYRSPQREKTLNDALRRIGPVDTLSRFLDGLIRSVPDESGQSALRWLERRGGLDPMVLLPLKARVAVNLMRSQGSEDALRDVLDHASRSPDTLLTVFDLIADEAGEHRDEVPASLLVERLEPEARSRFERWALRRAAGGGGDWLSPALRRLFASESERPEWEALRDRTPEGLWPVLAPLCLEAASAPGSTPGAFHWAVEDLLLRIPEPDRPWSPSWVEHLLRLIGSPYDLAARIRSRGDRLQRWLDLGRADGRLNGRLLDLLDDANSLALLIDGQAEIPDDALLSRLPPRDRGAVLELMIDRLASGQFEPSEPILVRCAGNWPGAFDDGPEQRDALARPIAGLLLQFVPDPELWIDAMVRVRRWLGLDRRGDSTWPPEGIAAAILTETCRRSADPSATWELRSALLRVDRAYRALCLDLSMELRSQQVRASVDVARRWDRSLDKGTHSDRFFEILLNACDGPRLAEVVPEFAGDLRTLGDLSWWAGDREGDRPDDLRVAFMMLVPMAPLASPRCLNPVEGWLFRQGPGRPFSSVRDDPHELLIVDDGQSGPDPSRSSAMTRPPDRAIARWSCLRALTEFHWEGKTTEGRWADLAGWRKSGTGGTAPPIASLEPGDQYDFLASLILALDHPGADSYEVEALARWAVKGLGLHSRSRLLNCIEAIASRGVEVPPGRRRLARDLAHQMGQQLDD
jgi:hypothetical protein